MSDNEKLELKATINVVDELPDELKKEETRVFEKIEEKEKSPVLDQIEDSIEEEDNLEKELQEIEQSIADATNIDKMLEESKDMSEDEKRLLKEVISTENGQIDIDYKKAIVEATKLAIRDEFTKDENMKKLLPYIFTTDEKENTIDIPEYNIEIDNTKYYLQDKYKAATMNAVGDKEYTLYILNAMKISMDMEGVEIKDENDKNIKHDLLYRFFSMERSVEDILRNRFNDIMVNKAYVTAVDEVFDLSRAEVTRVLSYAEDKGISKTSYKLLKGWINKKIIPKKNKNNSYIGITQAFSDLLDDLGVLFNLAWERTIDKVEIDFYAHLEKVNKGEFLSGKIQAIRLTYAIAKELSHSYSDKRKLWTLANIENQIYETSFENCYLYKKLVELCEKISEKMEEEKDYTPEQKKVIRKEEIGFKK